MTDPRLRTHDVYLDSARYVPPEGWSVASVRLGELGCVRIQRWYGGAQPYLHERPVFGRVELVHRETGEVAT